MLAEMLPNKDDDCGRTLSSFAFAIVLFLSSFATVQTSASMIRGGCQRGGREEDGESCSGEQHDVTGVDVGMSKLMACQRRVCQGNKSTKSPANPKKKSAPGLFNRQEDPNF